MHPIVWNTRGKKTLKQNIDEKHWMPMKFYARIPYLSITPTLTFKNIQLCTNLNILLTLIRIKCVDVLHAINTEADTSPTEAKRTQKKRENMFGNRYYILLIGSFDTVLNVVFQWWHGILIAWHQNLYHVSYCNNEKRKKNVFSSRNSHVSDKNNKYE